VKNKYAEAQNCILQVVQYIVVQMFEDKNLRCPKLIFIEISKMFEFDIFPKFSQPLRHAPRVLTSVYVFLRVDVVRNRRNYETVKISACKFHQAFTITVLNTRSRNNAQPCHFLKQFAPK
jgi:hypothetical protein